jgi:exosortase A-associated hydrolase 1
MNSLHEKALVFDCAADRLFGILHVPLSNPRPIGVLVVVGGPQYRAGSHRQFVLMARVLASAGYPVLRFDHRGIGDSDGAPRSFENLDDDVRAGLDALHAEVPALQGSVIFGLCDAASAALMYCRRDPRLAGLMLANPWVHSEAGAAKAYVKHYYGRRLLQRGFLAQGDLGRIRRGRLAARPVRQAEHQRPGFERAARFVPGAHDRRICDLRGVRCWCRSVGATLRPPNSWISASPTTAGAQLWRGATSNCGATNTPTTPLPQPARSPRRWPTARPGSMGCTFAEFGGSPWH